MRSTSNKTFPSPDLSDRTFYLPRYVCGFIYVTGCINCYLILQILNNHYWFSNFILNFQLKAQWFISCSHCFGRKCIWPKGEAVKKECRIFHTEEHCDFYCSPNIIRVGHQEEWDEGAFVTYGERSAYMIFVGETRGKEPLVRPRRRW